MAGTKDFSSIGLRDLSVAARLTSPGSATWIRVYGATDASFKMSVTEVEQWGDDTLQNTFYHSQKGTISCKATFQSMAIFEALSGNAVTSSSGSEIINIGTTAELTPPHVAVKAHIANARLRSTGVAASVTVYFYNCTAKTTFEQLDAALGKLQEMTLNFATYISDYDEDGNTLGTPCFGRLVVG